MRFPFNSLMRMAQKVIIFCAIFIVINSIINGVALAADRDVIVGFNKPVGPSEKALVQSHGGLVKKSFHLIPAIAARIPENNITKMKKDSRVVYVEDDKIFEVADEYTNSWGIRYIGSDMVHSQGIVGTGVKVAVLDTGIDYNHEDLNDNYKGGTGFVQDPNGNVNPSNFDDSYNSHGTHVAGIIAAENNGVGVIGVAPNAGIYALKVLDGTGSGQASWIIAGIQWAVDNNMNIATMSIQLRECTADCPPGYNEGLQSMHDAVDKAYNSGLLLVAAGGNTYGGPVRYPAAYNSVIAVTAINDTYQKASFSPIGPEIELAAPGVAIYSTVNGGYGYLSGTSMAAPHVTGVAALIMSTNFQDINGDGIKNNSDVRIILQNTARDIGDQGKDNIYGYGIVDASMAILGISAYRPADLSIVKDDGVSTVVAGEGPIYRYTITVKNNGPWDAFDVKVSDTWPSGFIRGIITTSGNCNAVGINFVCDIGKLTAGGVLTITVDYSVPLSTFEVSQRSYTNKVDVISHITPDSDISNNSAVDTNIVNKAKMMLVRTKGSPNDDLKRINLSQGNYSINIHSNNLSEVDMKIYENGILRKDLSSEYKFNKTKDINFELNVGNTLEAVFIPYGSKGSTGYVTIGIL